MEKSLRHLYGTFQVDNLIATFSGPSRKTSDSVFSPDGKTLATLYANGEIHLYNIATDTRNTIISEHTSDLSLIAFSPNGKTFATADFHEDNKVRFWDPDSGKLQSVIVGHQDGVASLAFNPDGTTLATASWMEQYYYGRSISHQPLTTRI